MSEENNPKPGEGEPKPEGSNTPDPKVTPEPKADAPKEGADKQQKPGPSDSGAPEKYADFKLPEGFKLDADLNDKFIAAAKELNLGQEKAQKLVDLYAQKLKSQMDNQAAEFERMKEGWKEETKKALGADPDKQLAYAAKARDKFGDPEFARFMDESGLGNHPAVTQFLVKVGKAISEDNLVEGAAAPSEKTAADTLYGGMKKK